MARESSRLETLFDKQTSSSRGYVTEAYKIEEIVREWELQTKSLFTLFTAAKHFGQLGKSIVIVTGAGGAGINFMGGGGDDIILLL